MGSGKTPHSLASDLGTWRNRNLGRVTLEAWTRGPLLNTPENTGRSPGRRQQRSSESFKGSWGQIEIQRWRDKEQEVTTGYSRKVILERKNQNRARAARCPQCPPGSGAAGLWLEPEEPKESWGCHQPLSCWEQGKDGGQYLDCEEQHVCGAGQGRQQGCGGGANVGAHEEGVGPFQVDYPNPWRNSGSLGAPAWLPQPQTHRPLWLTHEGHDGSREDTAALQQEG